MNAFFQPEILFELKDFRLLSWMSERPRTSGLTGPQDMWKTPLGTDYWSVKSLVSRALRVQHLGGAVHARLSVKITIAAHMLKSWGYSLGHQSNNRSTESDLQQAVQ